MQVDQLAVAGVETALHFPFRKHVSPSGGKAGGHYNHQQDLGYKAYLVRPADEKPLSETLT